MCTVTLVARRNGYVLGMNRDEKRTRIAGLPPKIQVLHGRSVLFPSEPDGGTWIALNNSGVTLALINWYAIPARVELNAVTRGKVVKAACIADSADEAEQLIAELPLQRINPFRLIGVFPDLRQVVEWQWNKKCLKRKPHTWRTQQWISSGFDEPRAQRIRNQTFRRAQFQKDCGTSLWLRRLHRSHAPECGPFSTCMHRADACTVSYTEVNVSPGRTSMRYHSTALCEGFDAYPNRVSMEASKAVKEILETRRTCPYYFVGHEDSQSRPAD